MIGHPAVAEIMGRSGLDCVVIDLEHSAMTTQQAEDLIRASQIGGAAALVRLTNNDENFIKRVMDSGATGIIVPMVNSAVDAKRAVAAMHYPPKGTRGVGLARGQEYGANFQGYRKWLDESSVCIVQIEHIQAVENAREILSVEGVDGYILGPYDLSASMGKPGDFENKEFKAAIEKVQQIGKELGKPGGKHIVEPDEKQLQDAIASGMKFVAYSIDTRIIDTVCRSAVKLAKGVK